MRHDHCLIVDVHSFSSVPLSHELDQNSAAPSTLSASTLCCPSTSAL